MAGAAETRPALVSSWVSHSRGDWGPGSEAPAGGHGWPCREPCSVSALACKIDAKVAQLLEEAAELKTWTISQVRSCQLVVWRWWGACPPQRRHSLSCCEMMGSFAIWKQCSPVVAGGSVRGGGNAALLAAGSPIKQVAKWASVACAEPVMLFLPQATRADMPSLSVAPLLNTADALTLHECPTYQRTWMHPPPSAHRHDSSLLQQATKVCAATCSRSQHPDCM